jgi:hypothetical protein
MKASVRLFSFAVIALMICATFVQDACAARPGRKKGVSYFLTVLHLTPKQFDRAYQTEKKENHRLMERSHRRMQQKQHGWNIFQYKAENHHEANHTHF